MLEEEKIIVYNMTPREAKTFRLALLWISLAKKFLPNDISISLPKGDPRKGYLFKICWKLLRETDGLIKDNEYKYYFVAQLAMLKNVQRDNGHAHISHNVLVGEKAWIRWKIWEKKFKEKVNSIETIDKNQDQKIIKELEKASKYLPNFNENELIDLVNSGKVPLTYIELSPIAKKIVNDPEKIFSYDSRLIRNKLTPKVIDYFYDKFSNEFEVKK